MSNSNTAKKTETETAGTIPAFRELGNPDIKAAAIHKKPASKPTPRDQVINNLSRIDS